MFTRLPYVGSHEIQGAGIGLALTKLLVLWMKGSIGLESGSPAAKSNMDYTTLYIEDDIASRELLKMDIIFNTGISLLTANTAEEGIEIADEKVPRLIFIDINLLKMNGIEAVKILKLNPKLRHTKMVALSAEVVPSHIEKAMQAGFDEYLTKPIDLDQVLRIIEEL